ncbi:hypothetical protein HDU97_005257 [Phlyctochytrium planicorne]|nr:hypothetical protein HDU97_005257 [Phlyctochytrium planicorne]
MLGLIATTISATILTTIIYTISTSFTPSRVSRKRLPPTAKSLTRPNNRLLEYFEFGSTDPTATVLLALHGSSTTGNLFKPLDAWCLDHNVRIVAPTLPGYGLTSWVPVEDMEAWMEDVEALLAEVGAERFHVAGASLGSVYAQWVVCRAGLRERVLNVAFYVPVAPWLEGRFGGVWGVEVEETGFEEGAGDVVGCADD